MPFLRISLFALLLCLSTTSFSQKATYIANSGIFIQSGETKILIDSFFDNGRGKFATPGATQLDAMVAGKSPYNNLSLALVTHSHPDHFNQQKVAKLMSTQKNLNCLTTPQVVDSIESVMDNFESIHDRTLTFPLSRTWKTYSKGGLTVKAAYSRHAGKINAKVQDLIFIVNVNGKKILHLGDADMNPDRFQELKLKYENIDVAFIPFWYMTGFYGAEIINKYIAPKKVVAVHFPNNGSKQSLAKIKQFVPEAIIFQNPGQSVTF